MKRSLLVLGMHRSGTSATAGALRLLGFDLGRHLLDPSSDNSAGYWENACIVQINEALLRALDRTWDDFRFFGDADLVRAAGKVNVDVGSILGDEFRESDLVAVKDPRMCLTFEVWRKAFVVRSYAVSVLVVCRDPDEVVRSLEKRDHMPRAIGYCLYIRYMLEAVRAAIDVEAHSSLDYSELLRDWRSVIARVLGDLGFVELLDFASTGAAVDRFIDGSMSHGGSALEGDSASGVQELRDIAISSFEFARDCSMWTKAGLAKLSKRFKLCLSEQGDANAARFDTHFRWCARHAQSVESLRGMLQANIEELHRLQEGLRGATQLAVDRLGRIERQQKQLVKLKAIGGLLKQARAELAVVSASQQELRSRSNELQDALERSNDSAAERLRIFGEQNERIQVQETRINELCSESINRLELAESKDAEARRLSEALGDVTQLCVERMGKIHEQEKRLVALEQRVEELGAQSLERLELAELKDAESRRLAEALANVTELCDRRLEKIHEQEASLRDYDEALNSVSAQSLDRLAEQERLSTQLQSERAILTDTQKALERSSALAVERLQVLEEQERYLAVLERRVDELSAQSLERLELAELKDAESRRLTEALANVTELCDRRLEKIHEQEASLRDYDEALNAVREQSLDRLAQQERLSTQLQRERATLVDTQKALERSSALAVERLQALEEQERYLAVLERRVDELGIQSLERLELAEAKDAELHRVSEALARVTSLCEERLAKIHGLESELTLYDGKLNDVERFSSNKIGALERALLQLDQEKTILKSELIASREQILNLSDAYRHLVVKHERTTRSAKRLHDKALRFASQAIEARRSWLKTLRGGISRRKGG